MKNYTVSFILSTAEKIQYECIGFENSRKAIQYALTRLRRINDNAYYEIIAIHCFENVK